MSLIDTIDQLQTLLHKLSKDLLKTQRGNKTAAQRVRTGTIALEKLAKVFRKQSLEVEKSGKLKQKGKPFGKAASKKTARKSKRKRS